MTLHSSTHNGHKYIVPSPPPNIFENYFNFNIFFLKLSALWFYDGDTKTPQVRKTIQLTYNVFWCFYLHFCYFPFEVLYIFFNWGDLDESLRSLRDSGNHISLIFKGLNYFACRKEVLKMMEELQSNEFHYENYELGKFKFNPEAIVREEKKLSFKWSLYFWFFTNAICFTMLSSTLSVFFFFGDQQYINTTNGTKMYNQKALINLLVFPTNTRASYLSVFFYTIVALTFYAWMICSLDSLFITLMSCVTAHLKILQGAFKTLRARCVKRLGLKHQDNRLVKVVVLHDSEDLNKEMLQELRKCIKHLQKIFSVSERLETIYHGQTLFQTLISLAEICFSLYLMSEKIDASVGNELTYLIATGFELLMYCWFGNKITEASKQLSYSIYDTEWFSSSLAYRKELIFTLTRLQRPIYVTIGKFTPLTFHTFLTIVRGAYSFFTFLKQR